MDRFTATTRVLTGAPAVSRSYVYDRKTGKPVAHCTHNHRNLATAQQCADGMLRRFMRKNATTLGIPVCGFCHWPMKVYKGALSCRQCGFAKDR